MFLPHWMIESNSRMPRDFFDPTPEQQSVVLINTATVHEAEKLIESCEGCNPEGAEIPFDNILDRVTLHCLVLDGVYRNSTAVFHEVAAPTLEELQALLAKIITRIIRVLTKHGFLIEEQDRTYLAEADRESALLPLQAASCTYRIALEPRAGQKVLSLQSVPSPDKRSTPDLCAKLHGFTLHAAVRCSARNWSTCAAISPARRSPMNGSSVAAPAVSCCNSRACSKTAPPISSWRRWSSCSAWPPWRRVRAYI